MVPALEEMNEPGAAHVQEKILDAVPLRAMRAGSGTISGPEIVEAEGNSTRDKYVEDLGCDFCVPVSPGNVNLGVLAREFNLPNEFEYKLPREGC